MYNEKIKIIDNNLNGENEYSYSRNLKIQKDSYLPRINLSESVNEAKQ